MTVSVIVPCYNGRPTLGACLEAIRRCEPSPHEVIVVDDGSTDDTAAIAVRAGAKVVKHATNLGRPRARNSGAAAATGDIFLFLDADVVARPDTVARAAGYLAAHPDIDAVTGRFSKECAEPGFFTQYKNLYMHYIFGLLPERVTFLFGSVAAIRRSSFIPFDPSFPFAQDTALGQEMTQKGKHVAFSPDLMVAHGKRYTLATWIRNDFRVPFHWARLFVRRRGWKQVGRGGTGFAHASKAQLASLAIAGTLFWAAVFLPAVDLAPLVLGLGAAWFLLNAGFFGFLFSQKGALFGIASVFATALDHFVMGWGVVFGLAAAVFERAERS